MLKVRVFGPCDLVSWLSRTLKRAVGVAFSLLSHSTSHGAIRLFVVFVRPDRNAVSVQ